MINYTLPHFGEVDTETIEGYYDAIMEYKGKEVALDLNFENSAIDPKRLDFVKETLTELANVDQRNKVYIRNNFGNEEDDTVREYIAHHLSEIRKEDFAGIIDFNDQSISHEFQFIDALELVRIGFYLESESSSITFDYTISKELTQYLLVLNTNENGDPNFFAFES